MILNLYLIQEIEKDTEIDDVDQYDSILQKLRQNIRNHTQSFYQESKGLEDSFIYNYNHNGRDHGQTITNKKFRDDGKLYRGSVIIQNDEIDDDGDEEVDVTEIFGSPL